MVNDWLTAVVERRGFAAAVICTTITYVPLASAPLKLTGMRPPPRMNVLPEPTDVRAGVRRIVTVTFTSSPAARVSRRSEVPFGLRPASSEARGESTCVEWAHGFGRAHGALIALWTAAKDARSEPSTRNTPLW